MKQPNEGTNGSIWQCIEHLIKDSDHLTILFEVREVMDNLILREEPLSVHELEEVIYLEAIKGAANMLMLLDRSNKEPN